MQRPTMTELTMAVEKVTPEAINFMAKYGRGLICLSMTEKLAELRIPMMVTDNTSRFQTAFTISIDARKGGYHGNFCGGSSNNDPDCG
jgi:3,4-dihydroxy 2-butanone 4-phosphate synthase/GTP cyclohydrolase II